MKNNTNKIICGIMLLMAAGTNPVNAASDSQASAVSVSEIGIFSQIGSRGLIVDKIGNYVGNKITLRVDTYSPDMPMMTDNMIVWSISDAENKVVFSQQGGYSSEWMPEKAGIFTASFVTTQGELEVKMTETLYVLNEISAAEDLNTRFWSMDEKMLGTWVGVTTDGYNKENISIIFKDDGSLQVEHYNQTAMLSPYPPFFPGIGMPHPMPPYDFGMSPQSLGGMYRENGQFELLDIWANGEGEGILNLGGNPASGFSNLRRVRFSEDFSMLFFEVTRDYYSMPQVYVLSRAENLEPIEDLVTLKSSLIGNWMGQAYAPWSDAYDVSFNFAADSLTAKGLTFSRKVNSGEMSQRGAFYFGALEQNVKSYEVKALIDGLGNGSVSIALNNGDTVSGTLTNIQMSLDRSILVFTFMHYGKYGPMQYVLKRQ